MSEDSDQKTEEPTGKRLSEARDKGQIPLSREVNTWFVLLSATAAIFVVGPWSSTRLALSLRPFIENAGQMATDPGSLTRILFEAAMTAALILAAPLGILFIGSLAGPLLQAGWKISAEPLMPSFNKISPLAGFKRLFSLRATIEFLKGVLKLGVIAAVMWAMVMPSMTGLENFVGADPETLMGDITGLTFKMVSGALAVVTVIAVGDYVYQRFEFLQKMRMTKQEVKEEFKQSEGDPVIKGRLRQLRMQRARQRMMAAVPKADVVVTNPTHFAVAMKYDAETMTAPVVVAKGADLVALAIRTLAKEHGVTIVENPPLARALFAAVEIDEEIPPEHYRAVAELISYVFQLKKKTIRH